jgi:hypothetical protein
MVKLFQFRILIFHVGPALLARVSDRRGSVHGCGQAKRRSHAEPFSLPILDTLQKIKNSLLVSRYSDIPINTLKD